MQDVRGPVWFEKLGRASWLFVGTAAALVAVVWFVSQFQVVLTPLILAVFIAIGFSPVVDWIERHGVRRSWAALIVMIGIFVILIGTGYLVVVGVANNSAELSASLQKAGQDLADLLNNANAQQDVANVQKGITSMLESSLSSGAFGNAVGSVVGVFTGLLIGTMLLYYILADGNSMVRSVVSRRQPGHVNRYADVVESSIKRIRGFITGATINAAAQGLFVGVGMFLLGIPLALAIGIVIFLTAFVPYIGAFVGGFFAVAMGLAAGGVPKAVAALIVVILGSGLLQNLLQPVLTGNKLNLHPMLVLLVTIAGGAVAGLLGFVLAAPVAAIIRDIYAELKSTGYFSDKPSPATDSG